MTGRGAAIALGAPGIALAFVFGVLGVASLSGDHSPVLAPQSRSLAEAAGNHDAAEVVRRLVAGEDLRSAADVRMPLKLAGPARLTPLEAAVLSEWTPMLQLLIDAGAPTDTATLRPLRCIAQRERDRNTIAFLAALDEQRTLTCDGVVLPGYVRIYR